MALNKLNRLHWHLVDDQGWRLPIDRYPRLTQVGAWRIPASAAPAPPLPRTGGVYTKAEIRDIVAFAAERGITIVPEIEMPGHALSAIRAYPELGVGPKPPPGIESDWGVFPYLYNVDDQTFAFLENVLTEVMDLFPGRYIHIGGDEAVKDQWRADPRIQARIKALGLADEEALQGWFVARIGTFLAAHGRTLIGWDEILKGAVPASATVMAWTGVEGATKAAAAGHETILAAAPTLYFDHIEAMPKREPVAPPSSASPTSMPSIRFPPRSRPTSATTSSACRARFGRSTCAARPASSTRPSRARWPSPSLAGPSRRAMTTPTSPAAPRYSWSA
jgi:hexosaminidase